MWPIEMTDILEARARMSPYLSESPLRNYRPLDEEVGHDIRVWVKHENHLPTNAFKARNALSVMTALSPEEKARGVVAATRGNHGQGLAWVSTLLGIPAVVCVPEGNNPEKNEAMKGFGAELVEEGRDYDEALKAVEALIAKRGLTPVHSTNNPNIIAGAGTLSLEIAEQCPRLDVLVVSVGGGSQAVGALTVMKTLMPNTEVWAVQAERASAIHDSWHAGEPRTTSSADTIADGLATRCSYEMTFSALREGLSGFITVSESELADGVRLALRTTHNLVEPSGAAGLAGLRRLAPKFSGKNVGVIFSGGNIDSATLRRIMNGEI